MIYHGGSKNSSDMWTTYLNFIYYLINKHNSFVNTTYVSLSIISWIKTNNHFMEQWRYTSSSQYKQYIFLPFVFLLTKANFQKVFRVLTTFCHNLPGPIKLLRSTNKDTFKIKLMLKENFYIPKYLKNNTPGTIFLLY